MTGKDKNQKQVYDATLAMISKLHFKKSSLSQEEMYFLLSLLDKVAQGKIEDEFISCLRTWQAGNWSEDIDEIIKASLLPLDLNDAVAIKKTCVLIAELINYHNNNDD